MSNSKLTNFKHDIFLVLTAALGVGLATSWNDALRAYIIEYFQKQKTLLFKAELIYAIIITILVVIFIIILAFAF